MHTFLQWNVLDSHSIRKPCLLLHSCPLFKVALNICGCLVTAGTLDPVLFAGWGTNGWHQRACEVGNCLAWRLWMFVFSGSGGQHRLAEGCGHASFWMLPSELLSGSVPEPPHSPAIPDAPTLYSGFSYVILSPSQPRWCAPTPVLSAPTATHLPGR